ncbi:MAG: protein kinase domain-containing protein [Thermoanaerobaculia bacterium]
MIEKLGKYEIVEKIGVGGFGTVYRGRDPFIKRTVAVKTCQSDDDEIKKRFFREAELSGNLHHRNITTIYDFGVQDGIPYIVQEYLTGEDLDKVVKRGEVIPLRRKLEILQDICDGLAYAHGAGIIHRDIKPSNIRVLANGDVKIMDFGIAKSFQSESNLTQTGITLGTAAYLAPEQIRGESVDPRTDIFSLGVLAYELFAYQKPFRGEHISTVLFKILNEQPEPLSAQFPEVPPAIDRAVATAMEKSPVDRYESVAEFRRDLSAILKDLGGDTAAAGTRATAREHLRAVPEIDNSEAMTSHFEAGVTPPSGALARSPNLAPPADATPSPDSSARSKPSLELMDFRNPSGSEALPPVAQRQTAASAAAPAEPKSKAGLLLAITVVLLAGVAAFYWFKIRPAQQAGAAASVPAAAAPSATAPPTPPAPAATSTGPAAPEAARAAEKQPAEKPAAEAKSPETPAKKEEPAPARKYSVSFSTTPNSTLSIDGKEIGDTVPRQTLRLEEGSHRLRFDLEDGTEYTESFRVGKGEKDTFFHSFPVGSILITAGPEWKGAKVLVDGRTRGRIPTSPLLVSPGAHEVAISSEGIPPVLKTITVQAGKREELHIAPPGNP